MLLSSLPLQAHHISRVVWEHFAPPKIKRFPTSSSYLSATFWGGGFAINSCGPAAGSRSDGGCLGNAL